MKVVEFFMGCGGAAVGYRNAGFEHEVGVEMDETAAATARAAGFHVVQTRVENTEAWLPENPGPFLVHGSPPCQPFSTAGSRKGDADERNGFPALWGALDALGDRARWLVVEQVPGILQHTAACKPQCSHECPAHYWHEVVLTEARKRFAWVDWRVIDAADHGVPQRRHRVFLVCGPRPIEWPEATHQDPATLAQVDMFAPKRKAWVSCGEALGLTGHLDVERGSGMEERHGKRRLNPTDEPAPTVRARKGGGGATRFIPATTIGSGLKGSEWTVERPAPTLRNGKGTAGLFIRTEQTGAVAEPSPTVATAGNQYLHGGDPGVRVVGGGTRGRGMAGWEPVDLTDSPAATVSAMFGSSGAIYVERAEGPVGSLVKAPSPAAPQLPGDGSFLATGRRRLTVDECRILMNFPEGYPLQGTKTSQYKQLGNAVVPLVSQRLAEAVNRAEATQ